MPLLTLGYFLDSLDPRQAVGTSTATIVFTSLASTLAYYRQKRIDYKMGLILATTTVPGSSLGAYLTKIVPNEQLGIIFGFFIILVSVQMIFVNSAKSSVSKREVNSKSWRRRLVDSKGVVFEYKTSVALCFATGFLGGLASGFLGIGGGSVLVPMMNVIIGIPIHVCVATSMFVMVFTSLSGAVTHLYLGNVNPEYAVPLIVGVIFGAQVGAHLSRKASGKNLKRIFGIVLLLVGLMMLQKFLGVFP